MQHITLILILLCGSAALLCEIETKLFFLISLQSENIMLADKHKIEKEQNAQLRNQVAHLLQVEQENKMQIHERDVTIKDLQVEL